MWLRVDTTPAAITRDLEEMHAKGIEGVILYDSGVGGGLLWASGKMALRGKAYEVIRTEDFRGARATPLPTAPLSPWGDRQRELLRFASKEAGRLGVKLCLSVGLASTSGPIAPEHGQQKLVWSETGVTGPLDYDEILPAPAIDVPPTSAPPPRKAEAAPPPRSAANTKFNGHEVAVLAVPDREGFGPAEVVDLSTKMDPSGRLQWEAPPGRWKVLRFAYTPTGRRNVWGLFTDGMSADALDRTWEVTIGRLLKEMTPEERKGLVAIEDDSWEAAETTWTERFPSEFRRLRRYDLIPWLPALAGKTVGGPGAVEGVKRDYYRTIADLIAVNHYARLRELAHRDGLIAFSEASGPNTAQLDYMQNSKGVDIAMGEFWVPSPHRPTPDRRFLLRNAASANHIYGKRITACESFTSVGPHWEESFFDLKNSADQAFADGCNLNIVHCFSHSPSVAAKPGYVYFAGTHYSRNVTWWEQTPAFNTYLGRCSFLLQQGLFVADALYYRGDAIGLGESMKTRPALPDEGYDHDNCNLDALLTRVGVKGGRLVLPDGMSYRILVLPDASPVAPEALAKIAELVEAGATVIGPRPRGMAGLPVTPEDKTKFDALVARLWGDGEDENKVGAGRVFAKRRPGDALRAMLVPPDFEPRGLSDAGELDWIHRTAGDAEIYFVASRWDPKEKVESTFRVSGKQPELWDPVTGEIRDAVAFSQRDGRTTIPLEFNPRESVFVVFRRPIAADASGPAPSNYPETKTQVELAGPWEVSFDPEWGGPEKVTFDSLTDWTRRPEDDIRHYSGTAVYHKRFSINTMPAAGGRLLLGLGEVREIASVRLNGVDLGVVWTRPARVDLTRAARAGENDLEVTVVNLWPNRLIADESLPPEKRLTETNMHKFGAATPLYPSGLLGPVTLESAAFEGRVTRPETSPGVIPTGSGGRAPRGHRDHSDRPVDRRVRRLGRMTHPGASVLSPFREGEGRSPRSTRSPCTGPSASRRARSRSPSNLPSSRRLSRSRGRA
jgi:hypothetical protein